MAVVNRTLDASNQKFPVSVAINGAITNGETGVLVHVPFPCTLEAANLASFNTTASFNMLIRVSRFIPGTGATTWVLGSTFAPPAFGTSGVIPSGISLPASGSTLLNLMPNDVIGYLADGGATVAVYGLTGCFILKPVQDIRVFLNGLA